MPIPKMILSARRRTGGVRVKGKWVSGAASALPDIKSTVQVATQNDIQPLPEGRRTAQSWVIYSNAELQTALEGDLEPDEVNIYGFWTEVVSRGTWQNLIQHRRYILQRITDK